MRGEVLGIERRRRWSDDEKLAIVSSVGTEEPARDPSYLGDEEDSCARALTIQ